MTGRRWLGTVIRARQAQEDLATQRVAQARRDASSSEAAVLSETDRLAAMTDIDSQSAQAFVAVSAARQAAGASHSAAVHRAEFARRRLRMGIAELTVAARDLRTMEKLAEHEVDQQRTNLTATIQRELDDISVTRFGYQARRAAE